MEGADGTLEAVEAARNAMENLDAAVQHDSIRLTFFFVFNLLMVLFMLAFLYRYRSVGRRSPGLRRLLVLAALSLACFVTANPFHGRWLEYGTWWRWVVFILGFVGMNLAFILSTWYKAKPEAP